MIASRKLLAWPLSIQLAFGGALTSTWMGSQWCATAAFANSGEEQNQGAPKSSRARGLNQQLENIDVAKDLCGEDPVGGAAALERALKGFEAYAPEIATKVELQAIQRRATLTLARAYHNNQNHKRARKVLNDIYRSDPPSESELRSLGPSLVALGHEVRAKVEMLEKGHINVQCNQPCQVYINERKADLESSHLEGSYRVYVEDLAGDKPALTKHVQILPGGGVVKVSYDNRLPVAPAAPPKASQRDPLVFVDPSTPEGAPRGLPRSPYPRAKRIAPLWLEIVGVSAGLIAVGTGVVLRQIHHQPKKSTANSDRPQKYETKLGGTITIAAGATTALLFAVFLTIDQLNASRGAMAFQDRDKARAKRLANRRWVGPLHLRF